MTSTTLRGVFPEPKPVHRRNFLQENIKHIKQMQGLSPEGGKSGGSKSQITTKVGGKYRNVPSKVFSHMSNHRNARISRFDLRRPISFVQRRSDMSKGDSPKRLTHRGVQTERPEDIAKLYESGKLKSPSKVKASGDQAEGLSKNLQKLGIEEKHDFIKENIKNIKQKIKQDDQGTDPNLAPKDYQKGALPKYLKGKEVERKEKESREKPGLALLPDDERKEYLRVARENYAALIKELNTMPVRNDTLKKRTRKIEIEDELKRLDEVIKIFQKPKVFVKADA